MKRWNCATATRSAISARASPRPSPPSTARFSTPWPDMDAEDQIALDRAMIDLDGTPNKKPARRQCDPRRVACQRQRRPLQASGLPLYRYVGGDGSAHVAGADDEHHQWRRSRRQSDRLSGIHDPAGRRSVLPRSAAHGCRSVPHPQSGAQEGRPQYQCRRRRRLSRPIFRRPKRRSSS